MTRNLHECPYTRMSERTVAYYEPPIDLDGTVFDPTDETFGPIMAKIKFGDFVGAARNLLALERRINSAR